MLTDPRFPWLEPAAVSPQWIKQGRDYGAARNTGVPDMCMLADDGPSCIECSDTGFTTQNVQGSHGLTVAHEFPCDSCGRSDDFWAELTDDARRGK